MTDAFSDEMFASRVFWPSGPAHVATVAACRPAGRRGPMSKQRFRTWVLVGLGALFIAGGASQLAKPSSQGRHSAGTNVASGPWVDPAGGDARRT